MFHVNMEAVIPDWDLSIKEGGIAPLGEEREAYVFRQVQEIAKKNKISLQKPLKDLPKRSLNILLYGNEEGNEAEIAPMGIGVENMQFDPQSPFEGIVNMLKRWFNNGTAKDYANGQKVTWN